MATTAFLIEILVIGFFGTLWMILLIAFVLAGGDIPRVDLATLEDWSGLFLFAYMAICYQLGWIINWISWEVFNRTSIQKAREKAFGKPIEERAYERRLLAVHQVASEAIISRIRSDLSVIRLTRSGTINFGSLFLVSTLVVVFRTDAWNLAERGWWVPWALLTVPFLGALICWRQALKRYDKYYQRIAITHALTEGLGKDASGSGC